MVNLLAEDLVRSTISQRLVELAVGVGDSPTKLHQLVKSQRQVGVAPWIAKGVAPRNGVISSNGILMPLNCGTDIRFTGIASGR